ncbi:conserved hypothetical protein [Methylobacterium sp. 4-46]|uniref:DUF3616 domain-containing protein n=1 Tax=unclassified Methylobacterium TaxID=2615210 RepID=UPI000152C9CC|nr:MULTISPECIES: DUF3616 domain-containing protein [Methylobacterium]ACA17094.1 conserved hypothetical protein [Methylobacterium sp. 4-46]WFT82779.1 DUF3616 domain-containing protein [Methylobacterium nodulans]
MVRLRTLVSAFVLCLPATAGFSQVRTGPVLVHWGMCEASGAVPVPAGSFGDRFLVVNDEDNTLRLYRAEETGAPLALAGADLDPVFAPKPGGKVKKADLEGAAWLGGDVVVIGSHSRDKDGEAEESRRQLLAVTLTGAPDAPVLKRRGASFRGLAKALSDLDPQLAARIALDADSKPDLAPKRRGLAVEGLAPTADGQGLLIGLRNPLNADNDALVVPLQNPAEVLASGAAPKLGKPIALDLKGRGIRDIAYAPGAKAYFIIAGGAGSGGEAFDLYRWSGEPGAAPARVPGAAQALAGIPDFQPEALLVAPDGSRVRLLSDDGASCPDKAPKSFRSVLLDLK